MLTTVAIGIVGLLAIIARLLNRNDVLDVINLLFFMAVAMMATPENPGAEQLTYGLLSLAGVNLALSRFDILRRKFVRPFLLLATGGILILLLGSDKISFGPYVFELKSTVPMILLLGGMIALDFAGIKAGILRKFFPEYTEMERPLVVLFAAISVFFGMFQASTGGVLIASGALLSASFYQAEAGKKSVSALMLFALLEPLMQLGPEAADAIPHLLAPDVLLGILMGAFGAYFVQIVWNVTKWKWAIVFLAYLIASGLMLATLGAYAILPHAGGMDAFCGAIIGVAIVGLTQGSGWTTMSLSGISILIATLLPPHLINHEALNLQEQIEQMQTDAAADHEPAYSAEQDTSTVEMEKNEPVTWESGTYSIEESTALISFKLGPPGGVTRGAFKKFSGKVTMGETPAASRVSVTLPTKNLTTFDDMRDGHLMSEDYLKEKAFPTMTFTGSNWKELSNGSYVVHGNFTMLGVKKSQRITMRVKRSGDKVSLTGFGTLNRTDFGMESAPSEGNEISFEFSVQLVN